MSSLFLFTLDLFTVGLFVYGLATARASIRRLITLTREYHPNQWIDATVISLFHFSLFFLAVASFSSSALAEPSVHVKARSTLRFEIDREEARLSARLSDEFGRAIPDRVISLEARGAPIESALSDRLGRADFQIPPQDTLKDDEGHAALRLRFDGDHDHDPAALPIESLEPRAALDLVPSFDRASRAYIDGPTPLLLRVHARSALGGGELMITLKDERGQALAEATTDGLGRASLHFMPSAAMSPGQNSILIESEGDGRRSPSAVRFAFTLYERSRLQLDELELRRGAPITITGRLYSERAGEPQAAIDGAIVQLFTEGGAAHLGYTDDEGLFRFELPAAPDEGVFEASIVYEGDEAQGLAPADPTKIAEIPSRFDLRALWAALPMFALFALAAVGFTLRARLQSSRDDRRSDDGSKDRAAGRGLGGPFNLFGQRAPSLRVLDARTGEPLEGAWITHKGVLIAQSDASGLTPPLSLGRRGDFALLIEREGFIDGALELRLPDRGASIREIALERIRDAPSRALVEIAARRGHELASLRAAPHRAIAEAIQRERGDLGGLGELVKEIDRLYYSDEPPTADEARALKERVEAIYQSGEAAKEPPHGNGERE